jgi:hypothetical protein
VGDGSPGSREAEGEGGEGFYVARKSRRPDLLVTPGGAVEAGNCHAGSVSPGGVTLGARSGPGRNRSGVLKVRVIVLHPWDSPASRADLGGVAGTITSPSLLSGLSSRVGRLSGILILFSAPVNDRPDALP